MPHNKLPQLLLTQLQAPQLGKPLLTAVPASSPPPKTSDPCQVHPILIFHMALPQLCHLTCFATVLPRFLGGCSENPSSAGEPVSSEPFVGPVAAPARSLLSLSGPCTEAGASVGAAAKLWGPLLPRCTAGTAAAWGCAAVGPGCWVCEERASRRRWWQASWSSSPRPAHKGTVPVLSTTINALATTDGGRHHGPAHPGLHTKARCQFCLILLMHLL